MAKDSFVIYTKYEEQISLLTDAQAGVLLRAMIKYQSGQPLPKMEGITQMAFAFIKQQIDFDNQKYDAMCEAKREAGKLGAEYGKLGGRPTKRVKTAKTAEGVSKTPKGLSKTAKTPDNEYDNDNDNDNDYTPLFISPQSGDEKNAFADEFFSKYPRYAKDRDKMRVDVDYKRLMEEFEKSTYLRSLYTVKQINEIYPCILTGDFRDQEKKPSSVVDADAKADRERWYAERRQKAISDAEKIRNRFMQDQDFAKIEKRLREIACEQGKAEARGDKAKASKLEQERSRLKLQKQGIIERNGMTEEDLEPKWHCVKCKDTGFVNGYPCDCYEG